MTPDAAKQAKRWAIVHLYLLTAALWLLSAKWFPADSLGYWLVIFVLSVGCFVTQVCVFLWIDGKVRRFAENPFDLGGKK